MSSTADVNKMMFKGKIIVKRYRGVDLEIEFEGSLTFLANIYWDFIRSFEKTSYKPED